MSKQIEQIEHGYRRFIKPRTSIAAASLALLGTWYPFANFKTASETRGTRITHTSPADYVNNPSALHLGKQSLVSPRSKSVIKLEPLPEGGYTFAQQLADVPLEHAFEKKISAALATPKQQEAFGLTEPVLPKGVAKSLSPEGLIILENTTTDCAVVATFIPNTGGVFVQPNIAAYEGIILQPGVLKGAANTESEVQHIEVAPSEIPNGANTVTRAIKYVVGITTVANTPYVCGGLPES